MASWPRLLAATAVVAALALPALARAEETPTQRAQEYDNAGKQLFRKKDYAGAANKFRQAIVLDPDARYYFNLCFTLHIMGKNREALIDCQAVAPNHPDKELQGKTQRVMTQIRQALGGQGGTAPAGGPHGAGGKAAGGGNATGGGNAAAGGGTATAGGGPASAGGGTTSGGGQPPGGTGGGAPPGGSSGGGANAPGGNRPGGGASARPASYGPYVGQKARAPAGSYEWSLGGDVGPRFNSGLGTDFYKKVGFFVRGYADFMLSKSHLFGLQAFVDYGRFDLKPGMAPPPGASTDGLGLLNLGGALYQHRRLSEHWYWTPLVGLSLALMQPNTGTSAIATLGVRGEVSFDWLIGSHGDQVITFTPISLTGYAPAKAGNTSADPSVYGLDSGGATFTMSIGYTMRFSTPFGSTPLITLE